MRFLGIDQSFTSCGIIILDDNSNLLHYQIITSNPLNSIYQRSWYISEEINKIIVDYNVDYIGIEGLAMSMCGNATRSLAILQGVIISNILFNPPVGHRLKNCCLDIITPLQLKKFATGNGKASKRDVIKAVPANIIEQWQFPKSSHSDLADAYFISKYIKENYSQNKDLTIDHINENIKKSKSKSKQSQSKVKVTKKINIKKTNSNQSQIQSKSKSKSKSNIKTNIKPKIKISLKLKQPEIVKTP